MWATLLSSQQKGRRMATVTLYQDENFGGYQQTWDGGVSDLNDYGMSWYSDWNDEASSLYTSEDLYVFEDVGYDFSGDYVKLPPGYHDSYTLASNGIDQDSISSFAFAY
jgi:hypothetical protein